MTLYVPFLLNNKFEATVEGNNGGDALAKNFLEGLNNATSYEGDVSVHVS